MKIKTLFATVLISGLLSTNASANADEVLKSNLTLNDILQMCVDYAKKTEADEKQEIIKQLQLRNLLADLDLEHVDNKHVVNGMTKCGMYMAKGSPKAAQTRQIRPMTFKTVHVYEDNYIVTQSGMVMAVHERKEGEMPPSLAAEKPDIMPPPVLHH
ncbi:hypothetical protein [Thiomicrorhabdus indica]|uniref:hypothetical protein n=1 Tax=Thiomicrorhabdus indica TaxID=2267253 RepID=UPI00102DAB7E|nr:hypothetical protein [Thiomicrorhabdus indica]